MSTADAVDRETAWLQTSGDGLPGLLSPGGPWGLIQAYWARTPGKRNQGQIYVLREQLRLERFAAIRQMPKYSFRLRLVWPLTSGTGKAEDDQRAFDSAVALLLDRIGGLVGDKTHGGRFLSVGENPAYIDVRFDDPERSLASEATFTATVTYMADDREITG